MPAKERHGYAGTPTYKTWEMMIQRCTNPNFDGYHRYGARGISVCETWRSFSKFLSDMGVRPEKMTLDRIDVNGNYCKDNCKWSNQTDQLYNRNPLSGKRTGIYYHKASNKWMAQINHKKVSYYLGLFEDIDDAIKAREEAEMKFYGKLKPIASVTEVDTEDAS